MKILFGSLFLVSMLLNHADGVAKEAAVSPAPPNAKQAEKIYKSVGPNGEVIYSDTPAPGSKEITLPPDKGYHPVPSPSFTPYQQPPMQRRKRVSNSVAITSPSDGQTIRNATGEVNVSVSLGSRLRGGQRLEYVMDGKTVYSGTQTSHRFSNIFRGTHVLMVRLTDQSGSIESSPVTFYMHRPFIKHTTPHPKPKS